MVFRRCRRSETDQLLNMLHCYGYIEILRHYQLLCRSRGNVVDYYLYAGDSSLADANEKKVYHAGIQVARLVDNVKVVPMLGLLSLAHRHRFPHRHYAVINDKAAVLFLYGRDVFAGSVIDLRINKDTCGENFPVVVVNKLHEPLGYGIVTRLRGELLIRNVLDAGWYLRSGV